MYISGALEIFGKRELMSIRNRTWMNNKRSGGVICLIVMLIFGCFSITSVCLLVRSEKKTEMEEALTLEGDYDVIAYEAPIGFEDQFSEVEWLDEIGLYYEMGTVTNSDERASFRSVSFKDELSEKMYHLPCIRGAYPKNENEIAVDVSVASMYGIPPYPGETISLKSFDTDGEYIGEKEYVISGVFRLSNNAVYKGWYRSTLSGVRDYSMPGVFFYPSDSAIRRCTKETVFLRADSASLEVSVPEMRRAKGAPVLGVEYNERRSNVYERLVGLDDSFYGKSLDERYEAIKDGMFKKDFYSAIVFPIISLLVMVTEVIAIYMLTKNILADRKERYGILRSIGMSSKRIIGSILAEILGLGIWGAVIGIALGYVSHLAIIRLLNSLWHLRLFDGIHVEGMIKEITYDPITTTIIVCICSLGMSLFIPLYRLYKMYPTELLATSDSMFVKKKKKTAKKTTKLTKNWLTLLNKRIDLHDMSTMLVMMIVISSALFGYVFFRAFSEQATLDEKLFIRSMGMEGDGYVVTRSSYLKNQLGNNVFNRHDAGIIPSFPELIENNENVERVWAVIMNESSRLAFDEEPDAGMKQLLGNRSLNRRVAEDPYKNEETIAEPTIFAHMGYDTPVYMYELPSVGLTEKEMGGLSNELLAGSIDIDKIKRGEEVVLAVPENLKDLCLQYFPVGSSLNFDGILLTEEEEKIDSNQKLDEKWIVYDKYIETDEGIAHVGYTSFGTRYGVETRVGAIVVLQDEKEIFEYLTEGSEWVQKLYHTADSEEDGAEPTYGMSVLCLPDSFEAWGLPEKNFTSVKAEMKKDYDVFGFDEFWYKSLAGSVDVQTNSTYEYTEMSAIKSDRVMTIFTMLLSILIVLGTVSIIMGLYTKTRSNAFRFQTLRRVGLSVRQASFMIYTQNMFYPLLATVAAIIPVCAGQKYLNAFQAKIESGKINLQSSPWYIRIPASANLFSYNFIPALICCLLLGFLLIFIGTLPQILYLRKMKMIETREE